jgi:hypothetical protein
MNAREKIFFGMLIARFSGECLESSRVRLLKDLELIADACVVAQET